jgi:hypothetical protein
MKQANYIKPVILFVSQIFTFVVTYNAAWVLTKFFVIPKRDISWGITVEFAVLIFGVISFVGAVIGQFLFKERKLAIQGISFLIFMAFFINLFNYRPYRVLLLLFCGLLGFLVPYLLLRKRMEEP